MQSISMLVSTDWRQDRFVTLGFSLTIDESPLQSYVIGCSILVFKLYEIYKGDMGENQYFAVSVIVPFIGATLGLLRHNWYAQKWC